MLAMNSVVLTVYVTLVITVRGDQEYYYHRHNILEIYIVFLTTQYIRENLTTHKIYFASIFWFDGLLPKCKLVFQCKIICCHGKWLGHLEQTSPNLGPSFSDKLFFER